MICTPIPSFKRTNERGGVAIVLILILLSLMGTMAFSLSREAFREIAITGNEVVGRKASTIADAGIDFATAFSTTGGTTVPELAVQDAINDLADAFATPGVRVRKASPTLSELAAASGTGYLKTAFGNTDSTTDAIRGYIKSATVSKTGYLQNTVVDQSFDLEVRILGLSPPENTGFQAGRSAPSGATVGKAIVLIRSIGRANVGTTGQSFIAQREIIAENF